MGAYVAATRGLAASLLPGIRTGDPALTGGTCRRMLADAGGELFARAGAAGAVHPDVSIDDLLTLVNAISLVTEQHPDSTAEADRLLTLALDGVRPRTQAAPARGLRGARIRRTALRRP